MIRTVYFDLGNVLIFFSRPKMIAQIAHCTGMSPEQLMELFLQRSWSQAYESGQINSLQLYNLLRQQASKPFSLHEFLAAASNIFTPNEAIWPLVHELKAQGTRLVLLSNTCECHYNYIYSHYPILRLFDYKVLSFEVGFCKPDRRIFRKALQFAECPPEECFYIDDIPEYIASAKQEGLQGAVFQDVGGLRQTLKGIAGIFREKDI